MLPVHVVFFFVSAPFRDFSFLPSSFDFRSCCIASYSDLGFFLEGAYSLEPVFESFIAVDPLRAYLSFPFFFSSFAPPLFYF